MYRAECQAILCYRTHDSATKETYFVHKEIEYQVQDVHIIMFTMSVVVDLPNLWIYPVAIITQEGRRSRLIFDVILRALNKTTSRDSPEEAMCLEVSIAYIGRRFITADPDLGLVYPIKLDLADA